MGELECVSIELCSVGCFQWMVFTSLFDTLTQYSAVYGVVGV